MIQVTTQAATPVAARIVKNQKSRFPLSTNSLVRPARLNFAVGSFDPERGSAEPAAALGLASGRLIGEIQGRIA
jgi:hypothetical protein